MVKPALINPVKQIKGNKIMNNIITYFSRHDITEAQINAIAEAMEYIDPTHDLGLISEEYFENEDPYDGSIRGFIVPTLVAEIEQDSVPFKDSFEILNRVNPTEDSHVVIAGVFPADILGEIISLVQGTFSPCKRISVITFKYARDRETNTVSKLTHTVVWDTKADGNLSVYSNEVGDA